jgi:hypothetical protein
MAVPRVLAVSATHLVLDAFVPRHPADRERPEFRARRATMGSGRQ